MDSFSAFLGYERRWWYLIFFAEPFVGLGGVWRVYFGRVASEGRFPLVQITGCQTALFRQVDRRLSPSTAIT